MGQSRPPGLFDLLSCGMVGTKGNVMTARRSIFLFVGTVLLVGWYLVVGFYERVSRQPRGGLMFECFDNHMPPGAVYRQPENPGVGGTYSMFPIGLRCDFPMTDGTDLVQFFPNVAANVVGLLPAAIAAALWLVRGAYRRNAASTATAATG